MTVNYTTNLALGQPVTGTESGTWGDDVNNSVTSYLDIAIAGGLAITVTTVDVTLTLTQGTSSATNIGSTTAQYAILNVSGAMTAARNLILPSSSRQYVINNNTTGGFALTVKGSATSGVTMVNGEKAHVFWNGSDYAKLSNTPGGAGTFSSITNTGLTSGRVVYSTTGGLETDSANLTFNGTTLTANTIGAFTLSGTIAGGGNQINNVIIGTSTPLAGAFTTLSASTSITNSALTSGRVVYSTTGGLETDSANLTFDGSRLGVGVNAASYSSKIATNGNISAAQGANLYLWDSTDSTGVYIYNPNNSSFAFGAYGGSEYMRINNSGNVGIGTPTPGAKLDVATTTGFTFGAASTAGVNIGTQGTSGGSFMVQTASLNSSFGSGLAIDGSYSSLKSTVNIKAFGVASGGGYGSNLAFYTSSETTLSEKMRIDSSGNVGIGTTSPAYKLDVNGQARLGGSTGLVFGVGTAFVGGQAEVYSTSTTPMGLGTTGAAVLRLYTNSTLQATLDSAGNLGLGVTPSASNIPTFQSGVAVLVGNSETDITSNAYYNSGWKYVGTGLATQYQANAGLHKWYNAPSGTAGNAITFTQAMTLDASGNLGIGTTSPSYKLDIQGTTPILRLYDNGGAYGYGLQVATDYFRIYNFNTATEAMRIDSTGNLLVGPTSYVAYATGVGVTPYGTLSVGHITGTVSGVGYALFGYNGTGIGSITQSGTTAVLYNVMSDQRAKQNIQDADSSSTLIDALQVRQFDWKTDNTHQRYGFIAQELVTVAPEAVHQPADPDEMMAVDYSKLVPMLVKEIQSLRKRLAALEST